MKLIVIAKKNLASVNIGKILKEKHKLAKEFFEIPDDVLDLDKYEKDFAKLKPDLIIVASSHKSEANVPMLNCHSTGNWTSDNSRGGKEKTLSIAPALYVRFGLLEFQKLKQERKELAKYEVGMEVTHHSPTIPFSVIFVEVGSSEKEWSDMKACEAAADVVYKIATQVPKKVPVAIGFGGSHYAASFNRKLFAEEIAFGHVCPKFHSDGLDEGMILQAIKRTEPRPDFAAIEWKGLTSEQKKKIIEILDKNKIPWKRI